jgi:hypothetical protein
MVGQATELRILGFGGESGTLELGRKSYETHNKTHNTRRLSRIEQRQNVRTSRSPKSET